MELSIMQSLTVTPAEPTWCCHQSLSELDQIGSTTYAHVIYFYPPTTSSTPFQNISDTFIDSLTKILVPFYPLAGRIHSKGKGRFELVCNGKGVVFVVAELNARLNDFGDFTPSADFDHYLFPSIDYHGVPFHELPLCFVQLTKFKCGGISLSLTASHILMDGLSAANFMSEWARLARGDPLQTPPFLNRLKAFRAGEPPLAPPQFDHSEDFCCLPFLLNQPSPQELNKMKTTMVTLRLSQEQVQKLKKMANHEAQVSNAYTRYEAMAAHIWRCSSKARKHSEDQPTGCLVTIDSRKRVEPPLPLGYLGNAVFDVTARCYAGELMAKPLSYGASRIRAAINKVTNDYVLSAVDFLKMEQDLTKFQYSYESSVNGGANFGGNPNIGVVNWMNLPFGGTDFGWGKETHFGPANHHVDGDCWLLPGSNGDGSVIVVLCLLEDHVEGFKKHFYQEIINSYSQQLNYSDVSQKPIQRLIYA